MNILIDYKEQKSYEIASFTLSAYLINKISLIENFKSYLEMNDIINNIKKFNKLNNIISEILEISIIDTILTPINNDKETKILVTIFYKIK
jgi:hypothetical protein